MKFPTCAVHSTELPGPVSDLLVRTAYTAAYDRRNRIPAWTAEHLNAASLKSGGGDRQSATFREDPDVPEMFQAKLLDYFRSGYGEFSSLFSCRAGTLADSTRNRTDLSRLALFRPPEQTAVTWSLLPTRNSPSRPCPKRSCSPTLRRKSATVSTGTTGLISKRCVLGWVLHLEQCPVAPLLYKFLYKTEPTGHGPWMLTVALGWASQFCRDLTKSFEDVYVFTVPLFLPKRDGRDGKWRVVRLLWLCQDSPCSC